jgi:shikimate dehydrogenase
VIVSGKTQICGIIGDPIEHSVSPIMHNAAFREMGLDYIYVPFHVKREDLSEAIRGLKALNIRGLNVTLPHKVTVTRLMDEIDPIAKNLGAVNTIVNESGYLKGHNTDAKGFIKALQAEKIIPQNENVVILGAGGAARAIAFILADKGANLTILNRHLNSAQDIAGRVFQLFRRKTGALELNSPNLKNSLSEADILINATCVGMYPDVNESPVPARLLRSGLTVFDIIYNPAKSKLLLEAEKRGAVAISGLEMLVWQAALAFELWTGKGAPVLVMREAAVRALETR